MGMTHPAFSFFPRRVFYLSALCLSAFILVGLFPGRLLASRPVPKQVLILHSYNPGYAWTDRIMAGMRETLTGAGKELHLQVEYLDAKRYGDPEYFSHILETIMRYKLKGREFDLLLLSDNDAFAFALRHRSDLFAGTPIVFCGINNFRPEMIAGVGGITGVAETPAYRETIDLALRLHPGTREMIVIGSTRGRTDRENARRLRKVLSTYRDRVRFVFWDDLPLAELEARAARLKRGQLVLLNSVLSDSQGNMVPISTSLPALSRTCPVPIYSFWQFFLGHGIVGGKLVGGHRQGRLAAEMALRVLGGEKPEAIPVIYDGATRFMFDDRLLRRFAISRSALPAGSELINRRPAFYELTNDQLWVGMGIMTALVAFLLIDYFLRKRAERALRASEEQVRLLLNSTAEAIYGLDLDGLCTFCNPAALRLLGYGGANDLLGQPIHPLIHHSRVDGTPYPVGECHICAVLENEEGLHVYDELLWRADGTGFPVEYWSFPVRKDNRVIGAVVTFLDITERKRAETRLQEANQELDAFVSRVAHDLRSPLTVIIGYAQHLLDETADAVDENALQCLREIEKQGERMSAMMEDLLDLARVGRVEPPEEPVEADEVLEEVLAEWGRRLAEASLTVKREPLPSLCLPPTLLAEVFGNLIGNAVRYAAPTGGPIEIGGERIGERVRMFVRDHGPGIPEKERRRIFEVFFRGSTGKSLPGTGIGLATVMKIARLFDGVAWVEETPGGGSTFWVEVKDGPSPPESTDGAGDDSAPS